MRQPQIPELCGALEPQERSNSKKDLVPNQILTCSVLFIRNLFEDFFLSFFFFFKKVVFICLFERGGNVSGGRG